MDECGLVVVGRLDYLCIWRCFLFDVLPLKTNFSFCIPLKLLLGFIEDYDNILLKLKQELVLLRSSSDINAIHQAIVTDSEILIDKLTWKMPYVKVEDMNFP